MKIDLSNEEVEYIRGAVEDICATAHSRVEDETGRRILDKLPQTYSIGDRFHIYNNDYILCAVANYRVGLINLETGARRGNNGICVDNVHNIPHEVVEELAGREFKKI